MAMAPEAKAPVVLITGCSGGGIGEALAREFAARGCAVAATSRQAVSMAALEGDPRVMVLELDVRSEGSVRRAFEAVMGRFGRIDVLVNNAGVHLVAPVAEVPMDSMAQIFDTNVFGSMRLIQAVVPQMITRKQGKIVNVGSIAALAPGPWAGVYTASKAALHALSDSLRLELKNFGISVITVAPGAIKSNIGNSSQTNYNRMPEWKYYKDFDAIMRARAMLSQTEKSISAEDFAKRTVSFILRKNPGPWFSYGPLSTTLAILYHLPLSLRDLIYRKKFKC